MKIIEQYMTISNCSCGGELELINDIISCKKCQNELKYSDSYICLFSNDDERPYWSMHMQTEFENHGIILEMNKKYDAFDTYYSKKEIVVDFFNRVLDSGKIIVDLASGPSGYFGTVLKLLKNEQMFFITDGSPVILNAHMDANKGRRNIGYIDLDLDKPLPFKNDSIDCFMGNYLGNVMNYRQLVTEAHRSLKPGGRFSVIEIFYDKDCETATELRNSEKLYADLEVYTEFCEGIGFKLDRKGTIEHIVGKLDPSDSLPRNDTDQSEIIAFDFIKTNKIK